VYLNASAEFFFCGQFQTPAIFLLQIKIYRYGIITKYAVIKVNLIQILHCAPIFDTFCTSPFQRFACLSRDFSVMNPDTALDGQKRKHTALHHIRNARYCISFSSSFSRVNATRVLAKASRGRATPSELESFISVWRVCSYAYVHNH
jgi:hypothetical protein